MVRIADILPQIGTALCMEHGMKLRNPLFVSAASECKVTKAYASEADAVILDLEDRVRLHPLPCRDPKLHIHYGAMLT